MPVDGTSDPPVGVDTGDIPVADKDRAELFDGSQGETVTHSNTEVVDGSIQGVWPFIANADDGTLDPESGGEPWTGDTGKWAVVNNEITSSLTAGEGNFSIISSLTGPYQPATVSFDFEATGLDGSSNSRMHLDLLDSGGTRITGISIGYGNQIRERATNTDLEAVSYGTRYTGTFTFDWGAGEVSIDIDDGPSVSTYGPFVLGSTNAVDQIRLGHWNAGGSDSTAIWEDITTNQGANPSTIIEWAHPPDVFAWDTATFQVSPAGETVDIYLEAETSPGSWTEVDGPLRRGQSINDVDPSNNVRFRVDFARDDISNNPTLDALYRRYKL